MTEPPLPPQLPEPAESAPPPDPFAPPPAQTYPPQPQPQQPYLEQPYPQQAYPQQPYPQQPYAPQPQQASAPQPYGAAPAALPTGMAITALVLGIAGVIFCPVAGPVAVVVGIVAARRVGRGEAGGKGMAVIGIVLGVIGTIFAIVAVAFLVWFFSLARDCFDPGLSDAQINACLDRTFDGRFGVSLVNP